METGRPYEIPFANGEIITLDLADLDKDTASVFELLREGSPSVKVWVKLAVEYWKLGQLEAATEIARAAKEHFTGDDVALPRVYALLANLELERARLAPKLVLRDARSDVLANASPKQHYYQQATQYMNGIQMASITQDDWRSQVAIYLTRGMHLMSMRQIDDASAAFNLVLQIKPTNVLALMGKARVFYTRRQYKEALRLFQQTLTLRPDATPDPRIGIGLCLWALGNKDKAKAAWMRSLEVNPTTWTPKLLLGLEAINSAREPHGRTAAERTELYRAGVQRIEQVFKVNKMNASTTNVLSDIILRKGDTRTALKLAERTIQYADTLAVFADGHIRAARVAHASGSYDDARAHYSSAIEVSPRNSLAHIGLAQIQLQNDEILAAIHGLDNLISQSKNDVHILEALIMQASLRAYARPALSSSEAPQEKLRAKELYERVVKVLETPGYAAGSTVVAPLMRNTESVRKLGQDVDMYVEIAGLWWKDNLEKATSAIAEAVRIQTSSSAASLTLAAPKLLNNYGVLRHLNGLHVEAQALYEQALPMAMAQGTEESEASGVTLLYNLARVYEDMGESGQAQDAYGKLLERHPEYTDAKARLAAMRIQEHQYHEANALFKEALASGDKNPEIRAFFIYFLAHTNQIKPAKAYTFQVLKDDSHDVYALCAAGRLHYLEARESRDPSPAAATARKENFLKAANIFLKALSLDPGCAIATQGLAIMIAEDSLGAWMPGQMTDDTKTRGLNAKNARQALEIFAKVRESLSDGSVYVNMGHCHFAREEYDKAIENYETASRRFYEGRDISVLLYLARTWFAKATKVGSFAAMKQSLKYSEMALHVQPNDKAILYNIAMIEQKAGELLFSQSPDKRTLADLQIGIDHAIHAQKLFQALASETSKPLPYNQDVAQQRYKYGDSMLRKSVDHVAAQQEYEATHRLRLDAARKKREDEKARVDAAAQAKLKEDADYAEKLAKRRAEQRAEAEKLASKHREESDEERQEKAEKAKRAAARKASKAEGTSGDEAEVDGEGRAAGKKRRRRVKKKGTAPAGDDEEAVFSADEDVVMEDGQENLDRPKKGRAKKRVVDEEDETTPTPKRKKIKSKETIESDEDDA